VVAKISFDGMNWNSAIVPNISADGLLIVTDRACKAGEVIWVEMDVDPRVEGVERFTLMAHCKVLNDRGGEHGTRAYSAVFYDISMGQRIKLDELITYSLEAMK
jgi:hypothetical protein